MTDFEEYFEVRKKLAKRRIWCFVMEMLLYCGTEIMVLRNWIVMLCHWIVMLLLLLHWWMKNSIFEVNLSPYVSYQLKAWMLKVFQWLFLRFSFLYYMDNMIIRPGPAIVEASITFDALFMTNHTLLGRDLLGVKLCKRKFWIMTIFQRGCNRGTPKSSKKREFFWTIKFQF